MELEEAGAPVLVTLIKPSAIDTPYMEHARSYLDTPGTKNPPPSYDPELVARAVVFACEDDRRDIVIGFGGWALSVMGAVAPPPDRLCHGGWWTDPAGDQQSGPHGAAGQPYAPREDGAERSSLPGGSRKTSLFLEAQLHPASLLPGAALAAAAGIGFAALRMLRPGSSSPRQPSGRQRRR
jgi:hypothetical protein